MISKPDVVDVAVEEGSDEFVLLASDGLWDVFSPQVHPDSVLYSRVTVKCLSDNLACFSGLVQEAVNFVRAAAIEAACCRQGQGLDLDAVCERLVTAALARGSVDNVSVIMVAFVE